MEYGRVLKAVIDFVFRITELNSWPP